MIQVYTQATGFTYSELWLVDMMMIMLKLVQHQFYKARGLDDEKHNFKMYGNFPFGFGIGV